MEDAVFSSHVFTKQFLVSPTTIPTRSVSFCYRRSLCFFAFFITISFNFFIIHLFYADSIIRQALPRTYEFNRWTYYDIPKTKNFKFSQRSNQPHINIFRDFFFRLPFLRSETSFFFSFRACEFQSLFNVIVGIIMRKAKNPREIVAISSVDIQIFITFEVMWIPTIFPLELS